MTILSLSYEDILSVSPSISSPHLIINLRRIPPSGSVLQWIPCPSWAGRDWFHLSEDARKSLYRASSSPEMEHFHCDIVQINIIKVGGCYNDATCLNKQENVLYAPSAYKELFLSFLTEYYKYNSHICF